MKASEEIRHLIDSAERLAITNIENIVNTSVKNFGSDGYFIEFTDVFVVDPEAENSETVLGISKNNNVYFGYEHGDPSYIKNINQLPLYLLVNLLEHLENGEWEVISYVAFDENYV